MELCKKIDAYLMCNTSSKVIPKALSFLEETATVTALETSPNFSRHNSAGSSPSVTKYFTLLNDTSTPTKMHKVANILLLVPCTIPSLSLIAIQVSS